MTDEAVTCPSCATELPGGSLFCDSCGAPIGTTAASNDDAPQRPERKSATDRTMALRAAVDPGGKGKGTPLDAAAVANQRALQAAERARREAEERAISEAKAKREAEKENAKEARRRAVEEADRRRAAERAATQAARSGGEPTAPIPTSMGVTLPVDLPAGVPPPPRPDAAARAAAAAQQRLAAAPPKESPISKLRSAVNRRRTPETAPDGSAPWYMRTPGGPTRLPSAARTMATRVLGALAVLVLFAAAGLAIVLLRPDGDSANSADGSEFGVEPSSVEFPVLPLESSRYADVIEGEGAGAAVGDTLTVNYVYFTANDGKRIDSSFSRDQPWTFMLGAGQVIPGLDRGLIGVKTGGRRQIDIIPELAYGDSGVEGVIAPGQTLTFVIDVLSILPGDGTITTTTSSTTTTTTTTTLPPDPNETALAALAQYLETDREVADTLIGTWVVQLDLAYVGLPVDGTPLDAQTILANHETLRDTLPVILIDIADWQWPTDVSARSTVYVTVVGLPFYTRTEARAWATNNGIARDDYELIAFPDPAT